MDREQIYEIIQELDEMIIRQNNIRKTLTQMLVSTSLNSNNSEKTSPRLDRRRKRVAEAQEEFDINIDDDQEIMKNTEKLINQPIGGRKKDNRPVNEFILKPSEVCDVIEKVLSNGTIAQIKESFLKIKNKDYYNSIIRKTCIDITEEDFLEAGYGKQGSVRPVDFPRLKFNSQLYSTKGFKKFLTNSGYYQYLIDNNVSRKIDENGMEQFEKDVLMKSVFVPENIENIQSLFNGSYS